jgi:hypothetical protein
VIHAYLGYNTVSIQKQLTDIAKLIKEMPGKSTAIIDSTRCINTAILCSRIHDVDHIIEEVRNTLDGIIQTNVDAILHRPSANKISR